MAMTRKLRMGMVGGGRDAFIGAVHRMAARMDDRIELVCGALSADPEKAQASGRDLHLSADRIYDDYRAMFSRESERAPDDRMELVSIVTPNHMHAPVILAALESGVDVVCDKPLCFDMDEARQLATAVERSDRVFALTHNYVGYPMVKEARARVRDGELGTLRKIVVEYPQGWLATPLESTGQKQAGWRTDPERAGSSCCVGDIGTHAANLAEYIADDTIEELSADLTSFVDGRALDDDASMLLRFTSGAKGSLWSSQIAIDEENGLNIRVYGDRGSLYWQQEEPNTLILKYLSKPREVLRTGVNHGGLSDAAQHASRLPAGHPEGYLESFANIYKNVAATIDARRNGEEPSPLDLDFPGVREGVRGMAFIAAAVESSRNNAAWTRVDE